MTDAPARGTLLPIWTLAAGPIGLAAAAAIILDRPVALGLGPKEITLLAVVLFTSALSLGSGRTTILQGAVHLVIFAVYLLVTVVP